MARSKKRETEEIIDAVNKPVDTPYLTKEVSVDQVVSTGSSLLDLAISGKRRRGGGIPGGIIVELYGPSGGGKSALAAEICAASQKKGGDVRFCDPEARLDQEYSQIYGVSLGNSFEYYRPNTVSEMFNDYLWNWEPKNENVINVFVGDSVAALSTDVEMDEEDKMGMRRAKEFSAGLRKTARLIANKNWLVVFTNQVRQSPTGEVTPGGMGLPFYSSLRIRVGPPFANSKIKKSATVAGSKLEKVIGINSVCKITKSSVDEPYREAMISIIFNYGLDTIRSELQYYKDMTGESSYNCFDGKTCASMQSAIAHIEENNLEEQLRERTIDLWENIESKFEVSRKTKTR